MSFDISALEAYTNQEKMPLIMASLMGGKTLSLINIQADIKSSASINILETDAIFQAGACGWNAAGTTTLSQKILTVAAFKQNEPLCVEDLESTYIQTMMKAGSYNETIPFEQTYSEGKAATSSKAVEQISWQGNTTLTGNLAIVDGLIKIIDADADVVTGTALALDAANIIDAIDEMVAAQPVDVIQSTDNKLFISFEKFRLYISALQKANLYHIDAVEGSNFEYTIHGTNIVMTAVAGLNTTDRIFLAEASNLYCGTDMLNDQDQFKIVYAPESDEVRFTQKFKLGFQIAFGDRIVSN